MKKIYAPWRHAYVTKQEREEFSQPLKNDCLFCEKFEHKNDKEHLILQRLEHCAIIMNKFPYNAGHLMVLPFEHKPNLKDLSSNVRSEMIEATSVCTELVEEVLHCEGTNVGINQGKAGGGGIPSHLHIHILPRWIGDTNFLATLADTTLICSDFYVIYDDLKAWLTQRYGA